MAPPAQEIGQAGAQRGRRVAPAQRRGGSSRRLGEPGHPFQMRGRLPGEDFQRRDRGRAVEAGQAGHEAVHARRGLARREEREQPGQQRQPHAARARSGDVGGGDEEAGPLEAFEHCGELVRAGGRDRCP